ncbi:LytR/AlgR family response regulator transcription factor [Algoriphagus pacificus]|uniref:Response regulator transcription factor n=1 Tax=Algoriphagus pacificus TaxID=2811234 RepID=A0ABS3CKS7_9BACT|nr:LytTR family DNA-binding domain-containing protein [Algoriphagus pacificus]MBN7817700.1 response regulator transcription factor [Algoriphagus pacificus]
MTCIIIDDEETSRIILDQLCSEINDLDLIDTFENAIEAIKFLNKNDVDLILLDIHMPGFSGFDFIQTLKNPPKIVLTTSDKDFAIQAFEYESVMDYLVKPITRERFSKALKKVETFISQKQIDSHVHLLTTTTTTKNLFINIDRTLIKIDTDTINLIESEGDYIKIKTSDKIYKVHSTLKKISEKLPAEPFFQVHRSYIVNLSKIIDIQDNTILIEKNVVPISKSKRSELMRKLNLL